MIFFKALKCSLLGSPVIQDLTILGASGALVLDHTALVGLSPGGTGVLLSMGAVILQWMGWPLGWPPAGGLALVVSGPPLSLSPGPFP